MAMKPFSRLAGGFLLASALFLLAAILAVGTYGPQSPYFWAFDALAVVSLTMWFFGRDKNPQPRDDFGRKRRLLGVDSVVSMLLLATVLIGVNYLAERRHKTFDWTKNGINSLAEQTDKTLAKLKSPVKLTYFYAVPDANNPAAAQVQARIQNDRAVLETFRNASDKIKLETVDVFQNPLRAPADFTGAPKLVVQLDKQTDEVAVVDEQNVTAALLKLAEPKAQTLYFLSGHGETSPQNLSAAAAALQSQNYKLESLSLLEKGAKIPAEAAAIVVLAPQIDLSPSEATILTNYLKKNGRLALFLSPTKTPLTRWNALVKSFGLIVGKGFVIDPAQAAQTPEFVVGKPNGSHPILRGVSGQVVFPGAVPLSETTATDAKLTTLFESSPQSRAVSDPNQTQNAPSGPFVLAGAIEKGDAKILVVSNASFVQNQAMQVFAAYGNRSFWLASLNWLAGNAEMISIPAKPPVSNSIALPDATQRFISFASVLVLPALVLILGTVIWWRRR